MQQMPLEQQERGGGGAFISLYNSEMREKTEWVNDYAFSIALLWLSKKNCKKELLQSAFPLFVWKLGLGKIFYEEASTCASHVEKW